eukprot:1418014-Rhodomonas_salina.1
MPTCLHANAKATRRDCTLLCYAAYLRCSCCEVADAKCSVLIAATLMHSRTAALPHRSTAALSWQAMEGEEGGRRGREKREGEEGGREKREGEEGKREREREREVLTSSSSRGY